MGVMFDKGLGGGVGGGGAIGFILVPLKLFVCLAYATGYLCTQVSIHLLATIVV